MTLVLGAPTATTGSRMEIELGDERRLVSVPATDARTRVRLSTCAARGVTRGRITPVVVSEIGGGRRSGGVLFEARLEPCSG